MWLSMLLQLILQPKPEETVVNTIGTFLCRHQILVHQLANGRLHRTCRGQAVFLDERHRLRLFGLAFGGNGFQCRALPFAQHIFCLSCKMPNIAPPAYTKCGLPRYHTDCQYILGRTLFQNWRTFARQIRHIFLL